MGEIIAWKNDADEPMCDYQYERLMENVQRVKKGKVNFSDKLFLKILSALPSMRFISPCTIFSSLTIPQNILAASSHFSEIL